MITVVVLLLAGAALAGGHVHRVSFEMQKQHHAMVTTENEWTSCKKSLAAGDLAASGAALKGMEKALTDLEKFQPHRKKERYLEFQEQARSFKADLTKLAEAVKDKKSGEVQGLLDRIDGGCIQCHQAFR